MRSRGLLLAKESSCKGALASALLIALVLVVPSNPGLPYLLYTLGDLRALSGTGYTQSNWC